MLIGELDKKRKLLREIEDKSPQQKQEHSEVVETVKKKKRRENQKEKKGQIETTLESGKGPKQITKMNSKKTSKMKGKGGNITQTERQF